MCTFNDIKKINFKNNNVSKSFENILDAEKYLIGEDNEGEKKSYINSLI